MPKASDGTMFGNQMGVNQHNARLGAKPPVTPSAAQDGDKGGNIQDDPKAMQLVDQLQQMGYTPEDVESAMGQGPESAGLEQNGSMAPAGQSLGMGPQ